MPTPRRPRAVEPIIVSTSFLYTPPALAANTTVDINLTWVPATQSVTVTGGGSVAAAPGFAIAGEGIGYLKRDYNCDFWTISTGTVVGASISNPCCVTSGQLNFRLSNSSTVALTPAALTMMLRQN